MFNNVALDVFIGLVFIYLLYSLLASIIKKWLPPSCWISLGARAVLLFLNAFLSLIDVGAFASFRLKDSTTTSLPEVQLKNIFAPGLGLVVGLPSVPISVGYMHQFGPALREINADAIKTTDKLNHR